MNKDTDHEAMKKSAAVPTDLGIFRDMYEFILLIKKILPEGGRQEGERVTSYSISHLCH